MKSYFRLLKKAEAFSQMVAPPITVAFLDVGQGDCTVITLPDRSSAILVDCFRGTLAIDYLGKSGIDTLSFVFLTHTDLDHIDGAVSLVENFEQVDGLGYNHDTPKIIDGRRRVLLRQLVQLARKRNLKVYSPRFGQHREFQGVVVDVLHPDDLDIKEAELSGDTNNASIVLRVTYASCRVLLTADIGALGWQWVIGRNTDLQADVLKFPHHGAWYTPSDQQPLLHEVLGQIRPSLVVLSVGTHNTHKHPRPETFELLRAYFPLRCVCTQATPQCHPALAGQKNACPCAGTVEVTIEDSQIRVTPDDIQHSKTIKQFDTPQCKYKGIVRSVQRSLSQKVLTRRLHA
jgi:beta-lactamase superfamily II metal-dependent hydrolase